VALRHYFYINCINSRWCVFFQHGNHKEENASPMFVSALVADVEKPIQNSTSEAEKRPQKSYDLNVGAFIL